ncbi:hypothetical protein TFLX_01129 [Thermoflexales bacterium]|nr:hypothetical protein TFLX_01129 [Thermoflexales bacterium]
MSPDVEWRVGEDAEQEIIAQTSRVHRSRRSLWAVTIAIGLGVSLGVIYRSIPEPSPKPIEPTRIPTIVPTPSLPSPTREPLEAAIQRDAFHLATSSGEADRRLTFDPALGRMSQAYADWYAALQNAPGAWGATDPQALVAVFETGRLPSNVVWADLGQIRNGDFFRHTRFYRWQNDRWIWTLPDWSLWQGATATVLTGEASAIGPLTIGHPIEEAPVIGAVFNRFTRAYLNLCQSLKCPPPTDTARMWTPGLTLTLTIQPMLTQPDVRERRGTLHLGLPAPRVVGYYEDPSTLGDPYVAIAYATLIDPIVRLASGNYARWETDRSGELFLLAIATWKRARVREEIQPHELFYPPAFPPPAADRLPDGQPVSQRESYARVLRNESLLPLDALWNWNRNEQAFSLLQHVAVNEAEAVIIFIEDRYREEGVVRFLNALGQAPSLEKAIETALSVRYAEFNRQWVQWIAGG